MTPAQQRLFTVDKIDELGVVLLLGKKQTRTPFSWGALEGVRNQFLNSEWILIGGSRNVQGVPGNLDGYVKQGMKRDTAGWVASLLEAAGIVELDRTRLGRMRIIT